MTVLANHSGPYLLSLVDRFNLWYRPIFGARRLKLCPITHRDIFAFGVDVVVHIFWSTSLSDMRNFRMEVWVCT